MTSHPCLAQPLTLPNGTVIPNRLVKSAMSEALATKEGAATPELERLYQTWAEGGIGLCITGNVMIDRRALGEPGNVVIEDERHLAPLQSWARAATSRGGQVWVQLNHPGKQAPFGLNVENLAPSAVPFRKHMQRFFPTPRAMRETEVRDVIARFSRTAGIVRQAGFTGVQIHGAHGYLVSQFLSPLHNQRDDDWGGSEEKRRRFVLEVVAAMRAAVGRDFPIGIKLNSSDFRRGGITPEAALNTIAALAEAGIDLIEISGGTYESPVMLGVTKDHESADRRDAYFLAFAAQARAAVTTPLVVTGGFRTLDGMANAIASGAIDFVGLARLLAVEPDLPRRLLAGLNPRAEIHPIRMGIGMIDRAGFMEIAYYNWQLKRMAEGKATKPRASPLWAYLKFMAWQIAIRRRPQRLRAT